MHPTDQEIPRYVENRAAREYLRKGNPGGKVDLEEQEALHRQRVAAYKVRKQVALVDKAWYGHPINYPPKPFRP
jgi:hypothetical protein